MTPSATRTRPPPPSSPLGSGLRRARPPGSPARRVGVTARSLAEADGFPPRILGRRPRKRTVERALPEWAHAGARPSRSDAAAAIAAGLGRAPPHQAEAAPHKGTRQGPRGRGCRVASRGPPAALSVGCSGSWQSPGAPIPGNRPRSASSQTPPRRGGRGSRAHTHPAGCPPRPDSTPEASVAPMRRVVRLSSRTMGWLEGKRGPEDNNGRSSCAGGALPRRFPRNEFCRGVLAPCPRGLCLNRVCGPTLRFPHDRSP